MIYKKTLFDTAMGRAIVSRVKDAGRIERFRISRVRIVKEIGVIHDLEGSRRSVNMDTNGE